MNKVILMGRLTRDPEVRYTTSAQQMAVARYSLAVNRSYKREGEPDADFINIVAFGKRAEFASKYFRKGMMVAVVGELRISSYEDRDGNKRWSTDVVVSEQHFAEGKTSSENNSNRADRSRDFAPRQEKTYKAPESQATDGFMPIDDSFDEDLPF